MIAVNTRYWLADGLEGYGYFVKEIAQRLAVSQPDHQFHFLFDRPYDESITFAPNVTPHVLSPQVRHPLQWKFWYDVKLPLLLRKIKADVFFSPDGQCSLTTRVPQVIAVHDLGFLHHPEAYKKAHVLYLKRYMPAFLRKARRIVTVSQFSKKDIVEQYKTAPEKISVVHNGIKNIFTPLHYDEQQRVKDNYTGGAEYFLYAGAIQPRKNLVNLLKAFSIFKRRLHSSFKLVLAGRLAWKTEDFQALLATYKYREDVVMTGYLHEVELAALMASAYAFVYPSLFEGFGVPVAEAMRCGVPVLTSKASAMEEISDGAAIYFSPQNVEELAEALMRIYKDEGGRKRLIEKGAAVAGNFTWEQTTERVWEAIKRSL